MKTIIKNVLVACIIIFLIFIYLYGAVQHSKIVNVNFHHTDQGTYMKFSENISKSHHTYYRKCL